MATSASRFCAAREAVTCSGEPGLSAVFRSSARNDCFWSSREGIFAGKNESRLHQPAPGRKTPALAVWAALVVPCAMAGGVPVLPLQASPMAARGRRGLAHHGMSGPRVTAIGHEVSHPSRNPGRGCFEALRLPPLQEVWGERAALSTHIAPTPAHP